MAVAMTTAVVVSVTTVVAVVVTTAVTTLVAVEVARARGNFLGRVAVTVVWRWQLSGGSG
jgi:hypothetical protein